jgi:hypothetical protein
MPAIASILPSDSTMTAVPASTPHCDDVQKRSIDRDSGPCPPEFREPQSFIPGKVETVTGSGTRDTAQHCSSFVVVTMTSLLTLGAAVLLSNGVRAQGSVPAQAQVIDQKAFNVLPMVPTPIGYNASSVSLPL